MIQNTQKRMRRADVDDARSLPEIIEKAIGPTALRWYIAKTTAREIVLEVTSSDTESHYPFSPGPRAYHGGKSAVLNIIPTGIGCSIGGYAGDAAPVTNLLAATTDYLITHPNSVNASNFIGLNSDNVVYTDGLTIDLLCRGLVDLHLPQSNKIGLIVEKSDPKKLDIVFNVVNTVRAVHGANIIDCIVTEKPIGGRCVKNQSGAFVGTVDNPGVIFEACEKLLQRGATAIALTSNIQDLSFEEYANHFDGQFPNPVGGVEAVISYSVTRRYGVPSAHAPLTNIHDLDLRHNVVDARAAGEFASASGLACVLIGLQRAPHVRPPSNCRLVDLLNIHNVTAIVMPATSLGGIPAIYAQKHEIPIIAVQENRTIFEVTQEELGLRNVVEARSYAEAAGILTALRKGISLESIARPLKTLRYKEQPADVWEKTLPATDSFVNLESGPF